MSTRIEHWLTHWNCFWNAQCPRSFSMSVLIMNASVRVRFQYFLRWTNLFCSLNAFGCGQQLQCFKNFHDTIGAWWNYIDWPLPITALLFQYMYKYIRYPIFSFFLWLPLFFVFLYLFVFLNAFGGGQTPQQQQQWFKNFHDTTGASEGYDPIERRSKGRGGAKFGGSAATRWVTVLGLPVVAWMSWMSCVISCQILLWCNFLSQTIGYI